MDLELHDRDQLVFDEPAQLTEREKDSDDDKIQHPMLGLFHPKKPLEEDDNDVSDKEDEAEVQDEERQASKHDEEEVAVEEAVVQ